ncbi:MAG: hypothetical protein RIT04_67 [Candidatus Parcubacteria bacterium]
MNLLNSRSKIITKVMTSQTGERALVHFLIVESETGIQVRVLKVEAINDSKQSTSATASTRTTAPLLSLTQISPAIIATLSTRVRNIVSPFTTDFAFFISQPTRAPSRA